MILNRSVNHLRRSLISIGICLLSTPASIAASHEKVDFGPYMADTNRRIQRHWSAHVVGESAPVVTFTIDRNGNISNEKIKHSSDKPELNDAALNAVRACAPFRAFPLGFPTNKDVEVSFDDYFLDNLTANKIPPRMKAVFDNASGMRIYSIYMDPNGLPKRKGGNKFHVYSISRSKIVSDAGMRGQIVRAIESGMAGIASFTPYRTFDPDRAIRVSYGRDIVDAIFCGGEIWLYDQRHGDGDPTIIEINDRGTHMINEMFINAGLNLKAD